ncbi:diguanylate cyclase [Sandarakinorhabdus sp. DWP1-3-1]|uniref:diguanylate cyclase n=1 Tax=Sandarakinorhabdus sp. DWP1-3-1 TaxID=2804627 RepID=UPI003CF6E423
MTVRIGFVGSDSAGGLAGALLSLVPPGATLEVLSIAGAIQLIGQRALTVLIVALDGPSSPAALTRLLELQPAAEQFPLPVFALVPRDDPAALVKAFDLRVADVAGLPIDPHEIRARIAALVRRRAVASARAAETRAVWRLAVIDPVTGLYNRHHLDTILPAAFDSARSGRRALALLMIDLDALKPFNDRWGHAAGDRVLRSVAEALQAGLRPTDTIARFGGDEIVVVMPDTDHLTAGLVAAWLVKAVAETPIGRGPDGPVHVTISVGLAVLKEGDTSAETLLMRADAALYDAKRAGRNQVAEAA